jgi:hypothetical protein
MPKSLKKAGLARPRNALQHRETRRPATRLHPSGSRQLDRSSDRPLATTPSSLCSSNRDSYHIIAGKSISVRQQTSGLSPIPWRVAARPSSGPRVTLAREIGQEHDPRLMGDHEFGPRRECDRLWRGAEVGARGRAGGLRVARRRDLDERARLGVADAESGEFSGGLLREDNQVCLLLGWALSSRGSTPFAATGRSPHLGGRGYYSGPSISAHSGLPQLVRRPPYVEKMGDVRFTKPISVVGQEDYDRRGGGACCPMPFIDQPAPAAMVGMTDSSLVDLKISRSGFHPNHTAPDKNKNRIPNRFST